MDNEFTSQPPNTRTVSRHYYEILGMLDIQYSQAERSMHRDWIIGEAPMKFCSSLMVDWDSKTLSVQG